MRPDGLNRVDRPAEVDAPIVIEIVNGGVLEWLASADTSVVHEQVDSPEVLDGRRYQVTATFRGGNVAVIRDRLASTCPNEVSHLFRDRGVLPEPRYVGPQVVHHDPGTAFGEKFDVCPPQPAACASHNRDLALQRNSFCHLGILVPARLNASASNHDINCGGRYVPLAELDSRPLQSTMHPLSGSSLMSAYGTFDTWRQP